MLGEIARRASLDDSECANALTVDDLCTATDWTIASTHHAWSFSSRRPCSAHERVFYATYDTMVQFALEPRATVCCCLVPTAPRLIRWLWSRLRQKRRTVASGQRLDALDLDSMLKRLYLGETDEFDRLSD